MFPPRFKREKKGQHRHELEFLVASAVLLLAEDKALPERNRDHRLAGEWSDFRECCHLKPDLLLIYRKPDLAILRLVRLGSHTVDFLVDCVRGGNPAADISCRDLRTMTFPPPDLLN